MIVGYRGLASRLCWPCLDDDERHGGVVAFIVARRRPLSTWIADICSIGNTKPELGVFFAQMFTFRYGLFELSLPDLVAVHESTPAK
jgi:hypothetical protein